MRHYFLECVTLLVFVFLSGFDSSSADPPSDFPERAKAQATNGIGSASRLLRNNSPPDKEYTEERAGGLSVSAIETFMSAFTSSKVNPETLQKWLKKGKSADATFKRFHLDKSGNFLFDKPHFTDWIDYADKLSARFPEMSAISTLTRHLYDIIQTAKTTRPDMEKLAIKLETEQMQRWIATRKDPDEVFRLFELNNVWENIFKEPGFTTWAKYVDELNVKHPEEPVRMYSTLTKYFTDGALFKLTKGAKSFKKTKAMAIKVEDDWIQNGIQHHKTPYQALLDVGLVHTTDQLMDQLLEKKSMLKTWFKYITVFNKRYPEEKTTMMETFTKRFGDIGMAKMFHTSKQTDWGGGTFEKEVRKLITRLESAQQKMWLDSGETTDDVFKLLKLDDEVHFYTFQDKVLLTTWVSYVNAFIAKNPGQKDELFSALQLRFEDRPLNEILNIAKTFPSIESAANKIQTDKIENYLVNNVSPKRVFYLLGLTKDQKHILDSPHFQSWMQYVEAYNTKNPSKQESWFAPLLATYNVERMFLKAMQNPSTMKIGKMMETEWMKHSLNKKYSPKDTFVHLGLKAAGDNALISPAFKIWTRYLDAFNARYPEQKVTMIDGLTANFTYQGLLWAFQTAKKDQTNEKLVKTLQENLIDKWVTLKEKPEDLKRMLHHIEIGEEMIQRYMKKISSVNVS